MDLVANRRRMVVIIAGIALVMAAGVAVVATQGSSTNGATAASSAPTTDTVSVSGTGTVEGVPDTLIANLRVHVKEATVQAALDMSSLDARKVIAALRARQVPAANIKSTDVSLNPSYDIHGNVNGYDSSESFTVHITPLSRVGQILAAATTAAGNAVSLDGLSFDIADNTALLASARQAAFDNAKAAAAQYAQLGGRKLARVMTIKAVVRNSRPVFAGAAGAAASPNALRAAIPIRPGQKKVSVTVSVVWALQ